MDLKPDHWRVTMEFQLADDETALEANNPCILRLLELIAAQKVSCYVTNRDYVVAVSIEAGDQVHQLAEASATGRALIREALMAARVPWGAVVREESLHVESFGEELVGRGLENLLDSAEVCARLGVSRQRLSQLRQQTWFPTPTTMAGKRPLWRERSIDDFAATWVRRPGRKKSVRRG